MAPANTHTAAKWSVLPEQMQQMGRISRIFCTIQLVASFAYSLQYKSRFLSLVYNTIFLHLLRNSHLTSARLFVAIPVKIGIFLSHIRKFAKS